MNLRKSAKKKRTEDPSSLLTLFPNPSYYHTVAHKQTTSSLCWNSFQSSGAPSRKSKAFQKRIDQDQSKRKKEDHEATKIDCITYVGDDVGYNATMDGNGMGSNQDNDDKVIIGTISHKTIKKADSVINTFVRWTILWTRRRI